MTPRLTPAQFFLLNYLWGLGKGRMTRYVEVRHDPRTVRSLMQIGWIRQDGETLGLTDKGFEAFGQREWRL